MRTTFVAIGVPKTKQKWNMIMRNRLQEFQRNGHVFEHRNYYAFSVKVSAYSEDDDATVRGLETFARCDVVRWSYDSAWCVRLLGKRTKCPLPVVAAAATVACCVCRRCRRTRHAAACGGRNLATRNELRPFPGPDSYALPYVFIHSLHKAEKRVERKVSL